MCEWPPEAESASSQVANASGANWLNRIPRGEKLFSAQQRPAALAAILGESRTRVATWRLVFICQRSISLLRRIVHWPRRTASSRSRSGKEPALRPIDAILSVTHKKQSVLPCSGHLRHNELALLYQPYHCRVVVLLLRAKNDYSHAGRWSRYILTNTMYALYIATNRYAAG